MRSARIAFTIAVAGLMFGLAGTTYANHDTVTIEPEILDFGQVPVGDDSETLAVTFTNFGADDVVLAGFSDDLEPGDFDGQSGGFEVVDSTCVIATEELGVPAGESCDLSFVFTPTAAGQREVTIEWYDFEDEGLIGPTTLVGEGAAAAPTAPCSPPDGPLSGPTHGLLDGLGLGGLSELLCDLGL